MGSDFVCFAPSVSLNVRSPSTLKSGAGSSRCTLAPDRTNKSKSSGVDGVSKRTHRVLPSDLPKSERPPLPPVHRSIPLIGFYLEKFLGIATEPHEKRERYGPVYSSNFFIDQRTYISDYQATVECTRNVDVFRSYGAFDTFMNLFGDNNMISNDFHVHSKERNSVAPAFSPSLFPKYMESIRKRSDFTWEGVLERKEAGESVSLEPVFREHYVCIVVEMTTGMEMKGEKATQIRELFQNFLLTFFSPVYGPIFDRGMKARDKLVEIISDVVRTNLRERADTINQLREFGDDIKKKSMKEFAVREVDILLVMMAESSLSTDPNVPINEDVVNSLSRTIMLLWFGGYTTSAATSMSLSFEMGMDDEIRARLTEEQDDIVAAANGDLTVTYDQTKSEMPLLDSFISEILRMYPPITIIGRKIAKDVEVLGRYVPKDTLVFFDVMGLQRDPLLYPDPLKLTIDRFVKKEGKPKQPPVLAFGAPGSPHYCVGGALAKVLVKTTFATLLRKYSYTLDQNQSREYREVPEPAPKSGVVVDSFQRR